jgi:L-alanine-DL-glutamate epimerase-like enolase superfamily enzyme
MKITDVKTIKLQFRPSRNPRDGLANIPTRDVLLVQVDTDEGITGIGEGFALGALGPVASVVDEVLRPLLLGRDPSMIEQLWDDMYRFTFRYGQRGMAVCAISAVDIALWDIYGKYLNQPIYKLLGGAKTSVLPYASAGYYLPGKGLEELADEARDYKSRGFTVMKMKIAGAPFQEDIKRIEAVKKASGDTMELAVDANSVYDFPAALAMGRFCESLGLYFFEEPLSCDYPEDSIRLAEALDIPIAGYETAVTRYGQKEFIYRHGVDIVQVDTIWTGGISECKRISAIASAWNKSLIPHFSSSMIAFAANLHLALSNTNTPIVEYTLDENPLRDHLCVDPIVMKDGFLHAPDKPGLGVTLDPDTVKKYRI